MHVCQSNQLSSFRCHGSGRGSPRFSTRTQLNSFPCRWWHPLSFLNWAANLHRWSLAILARQFEGYTVKSSILIQLSPNKKWRKLQWPGLWKSGTWFSPVGEKPGHGDSTWVQQSGSIAWLRCRFSLETGVTERSSAGEPACFNLSSGTGANISACAHSLYRQRSLMNSCRAWYQRTSQPPTSEVSLRGSISASTLLEWMFVGNRLT